MIATLRGLDFWQKEREAAEVLPCGMKILRDERQGPGGETRFGLKMWRPKAVKPFANFYFRKVEAREAYVAEQVKGHEERLAFKKQRKVDERGTEAQLAGITVGAIFEYSWGYDQTNVDYWEVVAKNGRMVQLREIGAQAVAGSQGFMSECVVPGPGSFVENGPTVTKVLKFSKDGAHIAFPNGVGTRWLGGSTYSSWYA